MKPKRNHSGNTATSSTIDRCQTPAYALGPLLPYLNPVWHVWECAAGEYGLVDELTRRGYSVVASDILTGENFFDWSPSGWNCIVTNPPYSVKYLWLERCYSFGKPFALLMPLETLGSGKAQRLFEKHGFELLLINKRVNFKMPNKGYNGNGAQFPVAWFTHGLNIGSQITFTKIVRRHESQIEMELA